MESYIGAAPSTLISQLDYSLKSTAPYVLRRRSVRMYPSSSTSFSPSGTNQCRITLAASDEWLDPSTLRFVCTLRNLDGERYLKPWCHNPSSLFQRVRELCGGTVITDVLSYARTAEAFQSLLEPSEWQFSEAVLGFGGGQYGMWDAHRPDINLDEPDIYVPNISRHPRPGILRPGGSYTCVQRLLTGMVKSNKLIPLRVCPLTYELTLETASKFCVPAGGQTSQNYSLENCYVLCDLLTLDSSIQNSYMKSLLGGNALSLIIPSYITIKYPITNAETLAIVVQRAMTRNVAVFVNFNQETDIATNFVYPDRDDNDTEKMWQGAGPYFMPISPAEPILSDNPFSFQLQLGSKLWPEQPMNSMAEMYETLRKAVGTHNQDIKNISLDRSAYNGDKFIIGVDLEKNLGDPFSAENTRAGDVLRLVFTGIDPRLNLRYCYVHLIGSSVLEIRETGAFVFD